MAARLGADAVGLVFYPGSRRCVDVEAARAIAAALGPFVTTVGLFLDAEASRVAEVVGGVHLDCLQFHGSESASYCAQFGLPYVKAAGMAGDTDIAAYARDYGDARGLLVDSHRPGEAGGTGRRFEWSTLPTDPGMPLILAGGLDAENVADAVRCVRPWAVDVSSGVEQTPGRKDGDKLAAFMKGVGRGQSD